MIKHTILSSWRSPPPLSTFNQCQSLLVNVPGREGMWVPCISIFKNVCHCESLPWSGRPRIIVSPSRWQKNNNWLSNSRLHRYNFLSLLFFFGPFPGRCTGKPVTCMPAVSLSFRKGLFLSSSFFLIWGLFLYPGTGEKILLCRGPGKYLCMCNGWQTAYLPFLNDNKLQCLTLCMCVTDKYNYTPVSAVKTALELYR